MKINTASEFAQAELCDDLLTGAAEIARFIYGDESKRSKIYYIADKEDAPIFRIGDILHARKSKILEWIEGREKSTNQAKEKQ